MGAAAGVVVLLPPLSSAEYMITNMMTSMYALRMTQMDYF
jgi:hypothetical protein